MEIIDTRRINIPYDGKCVHDALISMTFVKSVKRAPGPKVL